MPNPHFDISIVQRSKGKSAVAGAAYQSGEKLFSEYDQTYKDYRNKHGIVYTEILLPPNAPPEYADRATLWNAAEEVEKQWNSQLARRFVLALPREIPSELYPKMVRDYCEEHFVSKGMCCDFAIHDPHPPGHNPHCHVILTMRAMDEHGKWLPKTRKVYDLDENGERIRLPSGNWKSHKEDTVDWNEQYHGEEWRHGWEVVQNRYLEMVGSPERVDLRSYERQGLDIIPTVHMGPAVTQMERRGIETNIGNLNRDIKAANRMMRAIRRTISSLRDWITDILDAGKEVLLHFGYRLKILNTINFKKSLHYNPFAYIHSEKDILKVVTALIANTKGEGKAGDDFWVKAETLLYTALIGYIHYEAPVEEQNFSTLIEFINAMEVREDDEEFQNPVDLMFAELEKEKPQHFAVRQYKKYKLAAGVVCFRRLLNQSIGKSPKTYTTKKGETAWTQE